MAESDDPRMLMDRGLSNRMVLREPQLQIRTKRVGLRRPYGGGEPAVDFNGTPYTWLEGSAANPHTSIEKINPKFNPLSENGIALSTSQARALRVKVGEKVMVHDNWTRRDVEATYYDNAGRVGNFVHFEVSPGLADSLGLSYRNHQGEVVDGIAGSEHMGGRFEIRER